MLCASLPYRVLSGSSFPCLRTTSLTSHSVPHVPATDKQPGNSDATTSPSLSQGTISVRMPACLGLVSFPGLFRSSCLSFCMSWCILSPLEL